MRSAQSEGPKVRARRRGGALRSSRSQGSTHVRIQTSGPLREDVDLDGDVAGVDEGTVSWSWVRGLGARLRGLNGKATRRGTRVVICGRRLEAEYDGLGRGDDVFGYTCEAL